MRFLRACLILSPLLLSALAGCSREDDITQETVTYEDRQLIRLRVAIIAHKDTIYFIRVDGPAPLMKQHEEAFTAFVKSAKLSDKKDEPLTWTEPKEWKKDPPRDDRYATFRIDAKPKELEIKVSALNGVKFSLMENMHRWQKQVNAPLTEQHAQLDLLIKRDQTTDGKEIKWVDLEGLSVHTVSKPRDANDVHKQDFLVQNNDGIPFKFTVPDGWVKKEAGAMTELAYEVGQKAEVTLTRLGGDGGGVAENVNRWRKQIGLPPLKNEKEFADAINTKMTPAMKSVYVDLPNPQGLAGKNRIIAVMIPMGRTTWFVKMTGPLELIEQHKKDFDSFVKSFKRK